MILVWKNLGVQARFMTIAAVGVLAFAAAILALLGWAEYAAMEAKLRILSENELRSLNALVESTMRQRADDQKNVAIRVFNGWFESRNREYQGKLWSVWSPKMTAYMADAHPERAAKPPLDEIDRQALSAGLPVARFVAGAYRYSLPIVLGHTLAAPKEVCEGCHGAGMGLTDGEAIAVFSSSVSTDRDIAGLRWLLLLTAGGVALGGVITILGIRLILGRVITRPLKGMTQAVERLAEGDTAIAVPADDRGDEIGKSLERRPERSPLRRERRRADGAFGGAAIDGVARRSARRRLVSELRGGGMIARHANRDGFA